MSDTSFDFSLFIKESVDVLVNPKSYFSTMKTTGGMTEPLIKAVILLVISSICKGNTDFEANLRVTASVMAVWPIRSFFGFAGHFNVYLGVIIALIIGIYSLWLIYNGLVEALK